MVSDEMVEAAARKICDEWGYDWDADPEMDSQAAPEMPGDWDDRPSKLLYRMAARAALEAVAPAIRAAALEEAAKIAEDAYMQECCGQGVGHSINSPPECCANPIMLAHSPEEIASAIRGAKETA